MPSSKADYCRFARYSRGDWLDFHKLTSHYFRRSNGRAAGTARPKVQHRLARTELRQGSRVSAPNEARSA